MEISRLSQRYRVRRLTAADVDAIYALSRENPLFYQYCPPFVTKESILNDMTALPPRTPRDRKYYLGYFQGESPGPDSRISQRRNRFHRPLHDGQKRTGTGRRQPDHNRMRRLSAGRALSFHPPGLRERQPAKPRVLEEEPIHRDRNRISGSNLYGRDHAEGLVRVLGITKRRRIKRFCAFYLVHLQGLEPWAH